MKTPQIKTSKCLSILLVAASASLMLATPSHASTLTTYTYTSQFTYWANSWGSANWASYAALDGSGIKFEFTTAAPLISVGCSNYSCQVVSG